MNPSILLADVVTSALDPTTTNQILELLLRVNRESGITIVAITHHMCVVTKLCSKVAVMSEGHLLESGRVEDVITMPKHPVTQQFLSSVTEDHIPQAVDERASRYGHIYRLIFSRQNAHDPLLSRAVRGRNVEFSTLAATVNELQHTTIGIIVVSFSGADTEVQKVVGTLKASGVLVRSYEENHERAD